MLAGFNACLSIVNPPSRHGHKESRRIYFISRSPNWLLEEIPYVLSEYSTTSILGADYTFGRTGDAVVVNPQISSGVPIAGIQRYPQPASRPEHYATPATKGALCSTNCL